MNGAAAVHAAHALAAGVWLGGLVFTAAVVSPAFKCMEWTPVERTAVRSAVGKQYSKVARLNLSALLLLALVDGLPSGGPGAVIAEVTLILLVVMLAELHARYFAPRLAQSARENNPERRAQLLCVSISVSMVNLALSTAIVVLASLVKRV